MNDGVQDTILEIAKWARQRGQKKLMGVVTIGHDNMVLDPSGMTRWLWTCRVRLELT